MTAVPFLHNLHASRYLVHSAVNDCIILKTARKLNVVRVEKSFGEFNNYMFYPKVNGLNFLPVQNVLILFTFVFLYSSSASSPPNESLRVVIHQVDP